MVKFKLLNRGVHNLKCILKRALVSRRSDRASTNQRNPQRRFHCNPSISSAEGFIPLAAKDSQWVGLQFYNPHFRSPLDEEDDKEEVELQNLAADSAEAICLLFPGVNKSSVIKERESSSTTEITKLLVGQKADFSSMKSSRKLVSMDQQNKLSSVQEVPQEEKASSETDISTTGTRMITSTSDDRYDSEDSEPKRAVHVKRRKKKSDVKVIPIGYSSSSSFQHQTRVDGNSRVGETQTKQLEINSNKR